MIVTMTFKASALALALILASFLPTIVAGETESTWVEGKNNLPQGFVWIEPGTFVMGSPRTERDRDNIEGPQTAVTISRGFWMGIHEVTQKEFSQVMSQNPSHFKGQKNLPVEHVSWLDCAEFCKKLRDKVEVETTHVTMQDGDQLLLCTDGLTDMVSDADIASILAHSSAPQTRCQELVDAALGGGGRDNVTVVLGKYSIGV